MDKSPVASSEEHKFNFLRVRVDRLQVDGREIPYDVVSIGDGVAVLPFIDGYDVLLSRQYRHPVDKVLLELVQGGIKEGEEPGQAASRELLEETGYSAFTMRLSMGIHPLPGSLDNTIHIYSAHGLTKKAEPKEDPMEKMEIVRMPFRQVYEEVLKGKHPDAMLVAAVLRYAALNGV